MHLMVCCARMHRLENDSAAWGVFFHNRRSRILVPDMAVICDRLPRFGICGDYESRSGE